MDGVTVLNTYEEIIGHSWGWSPLGIIVGIFGIAVIIFAYYAAIAGSDASTLFISLPGVFLLLCGISISASTTPIYETHLQVIVDETCNINEFFEKYELIERQGEIYIIAEKE
jgi:hypothetical protein